MQFSSSVVQALAFGENQSRVTSSAAAQSLAAKTALVQGLKTFPAVAQKVMAILGDPGFKIGDVSRAVREDPALGVKVMRVANSAFYSRGKEVTSFDHAIVRLGRETVRDVVAGVATMELFDDATGIGKRVRDHCAATASIGQALVRRLSPGLGEGLFLAGLLHDIGKLFLLSAGDRVYESVSPEDLFLSDRSHLIELDVLGFDHAVLAGQILWHWQIPNPVPQIVAWHHQPQLAYGDPSIGKLTAYLRIADHVEPMLGREDAVIDEFARLYAEGPDCRFAGVSADVLRDLLPELAAARAEALSMFS